MCAELPPLAIEMAKEAVLRSMDAALDTGLALETKAIQLLFSSQDQKEGMAAFIEKRSSPESSERGIARRYEVAAAAAVPGAGASGASAAASLGPLSMMTSTAATAAVTRPAMMLAPASIRKSSATLAERRGAGAADFVASIGYTFLVSDARSYTRPRHSATT
jgi:hypothetical protein